MMKSAVNIMEKLQKNCIFFCCFFGNSKNSTTFALAFRNKATTDMIEVSKPEARRKSCKRQVAKKERVL